MPKDSLLNPSVGLLAKLGSIAAHAEEAAGGKRHHLDLVALKGLFEDPEVVEWLAGMRLLALIPEPR
jgi:hypothetical protein